MVEYHIFDSIMRIGIQAIVSICILEWARVSGLDNLRVLYRERQGLPSEPQNSWNLLVSQDVSLEPYKKEVQASSREW